MKIISTSSNDALGMFDIAIRFKPYTDNILIDNEKYLNEICEWVANAFTKNFVIIEHVDTIVAGGWIDNRHGWEQQESKVNRSNHSGNAVYELRCHYSDSTAFMLKWS